MLLQVPRHQLFNLFVYLHRNRTVFGAKMEQRLVLFESLHNSVASCGTKVVTSHMKSCEVCVAE